MSSNRPTQSEQLQAALACLDLSLESELGLYRRQTLQAVSALALPEAEPIASPDQVALNPESASDLSLESEQAHQHSAELDTSQSDAESAQTLHRLAADSAERDGSSEVKESNRQQRAASETALRPQHPLYTVPLEEDPETLPEPYSSETVAQPEALERFLDPSIEDYLESSEALLKHLDRSEKAAPKVKKPSQPTSNPGLKVLAGILVIAVLVGLGALLLKQFSRSNPQPVSQPISPTPVPDASIPAAASPIPASPSSAVSPNPSPAGSPSAALPTSPNASPAVSASPLSQPSTPAAPSAQTATPASPQTAPTASPKATPSAALPLPSAAFYIVIAPYEGDASYERARKLVPDAFIANIKGKRQIQLSFLEELSRAQRLVNDLKNQGFSASIVAQN